MATSIEESGLLSLPNCGQDLRALRLLLLIRVPKTKQQGQVPDNTHKLWCKLLVTVAFPHQLSCTMNSTSKRASSSLPQTTVSKTWLHLAMAASPHLPTRQSLDKATLSGPSQTKPSKKTIKLALSSVRLPPQRNRIQTLFKFCSNMRNSAQSYVAKLMAFRTLLTHRMHKETRSQTQLILRHNPDNSAGWSRSLLVLQWRRKKRREKLHILIEDIFFGHTNIKRVFLNFVLNKIKFFILQSIKKQHLSFLLIIKIINHKFSQFSLLNFWTGFWVAKHGFVNAVACFH